MKIYLQNNKRWKIPPDMLKEKWFTQYIQSVQHFTRIFSEESILEIRDDIIRKLSVIDVDIEFGSIMHYADHDYYQINNNEDEVEPDEPGFINELSVMIDKSIISYEQVYHIPPQHVSENVTQYSISLQKKSRIKMILEIVNNRSNELYFLVPDDMNIQDTCSTILSLVQLVKI